MSVQLVPVLHGVQDATPSKDHSPSRQASHVSRPPAEKEPGSQGSWPTRPSSAVMFAWYLALTRTHIPAPLAEDFEKKPSPQRLQFTDPAEANQPAGHTSSAL